MNDFFNYFCAKMMQKKKLVQFLMLIFYEKKFGCFIIKSWLFFKFFK